MPTFWLFRHIAIAARSADTVGEQRVMLWNFGFNAPFLPQSAAGGEGPRLVLLFPHGELPHLLSA
jgi:hypothetical protein